MKEILKGIDNKWVRLTILVVVFANTAGMMLGYQILPFDNEQIAAGISIVALAASEIWNHWKNNSYTKPAQEADTYLKSRKEKLKNQ